MSDEHRALSPVGRASMWGHPRGRWKFWGCRKRSSQLGSPKTAVRRTQFYLQKRASNWAPDSQWTPKATRYLPTALFLKFLCISVLSRSLFGYFFLFSTLLFPACETLIQQTHSIPTPVCAWPFESHKPLLPWN